MSAPRPVLVGGALTGRGVWAEQLPRFEGAASLELLDAPGETIEAWEDWLAAALSTMDRPLAVVAHGLAAAVALGLAARDPDALDGLVLVGLGAEAIPLEDPSPAEIAGRLLAEPLEPGLSRARSELERRSPALLRRDVAAWVGFRSAGRLGATSCPVLVIAGGRDSLVDARSAQALADELPSAGLAVLPEAAHASPIEAAGAVDLLVAAFLTRLELVLDAP